MASIPAVATPPPTRITVLISGNGSNLQALIDATTSGLIPSAQIIRVVSNKKDAFGLQRAASANIPTTYFNIISNGYRSAARTSRRPEETDADVTKRAREEYCTGLAELVLADQPDLVVCAGWMMVLSPTFLDPLAEKGLPIINLHPALPGCYDGTAAIERAHTDFLAGKLDRDTTGVMIHKVISEVDRGDPLLVREVKIEQGETLEQLTERIHSIEHEAIVKGTGIAIATLWESRRAAES